MSDYRFERDLPMLGQYDVLVAGGGPAGICAAVAASRQGARVALVERYGVLGGNMVLGHVAPILGMVGKGTMRDELMELMGVPDNDMIGETGVAHDIEKAKYVITKLVSEASVDVMLQTTVADVIMDGDVLKGLVVAGKQGLGAVYAGVTVDASGDGDVACYAGAPYGLGREDGLMQPVSLEFTIAGVDEEKGLICIGDVDDVQLNGQRFLDYTKQCAESGLLPEILSAVRLHPTTVPGERRVNTTQVNGVNPLCWEQLFPAEVELREQIEILVAFLRNHLPGYEQIRLVDSASTLGVRESRRILGEYVITTEDMSAGRRFEDAIVHDAEFIIDIHNPSGPGQAEEVIQQVKPYDIPYRCLIPQKTENLLLSGRCISGTHRAHASYRIMSICMATGQAAGVAAAVCARQNISPRNMGARLVQQALKAQGVQLFDQ